MLVCFFVVIVPLENYDDVKMVRAAIYTCSALWPLSREDIIAGHTHFVEPMGCIYIVPQSFLGFTGSL